MQTSAKTKAKEFWKRYNQGLNGSEYDISVLEKLLLEHERDSRYTAIDIIRSQEEEFIYDESRDYFSVGHVHTEDIISKIHNMKIGG